MQEKQPIFYLNAEREESVYQVIKKDCHHQDETLLWRKFLEGDEQALVEIYETYSQKMYNYGCQFTIEKELVRDCVQELFMELIDKRSKLGKTPSIKFYLFKSLRRKLHRALKRRKMIAGKEDSFYYQFYMQENQHVRFIQQEIDQQTKVIIANECNKLPPKQREALLLYYYEGLSYKEIASIMGMTRTKSARALLYRTIDTLTLQFNRYKEVIFPFTSLIIFGFLTWFQ